MVRFGMPRSAAWWPFCQLGSHAGKRRQRGGRTGQKASPANDREPEWHEMVGFFEKMGDPQVTMAFNTQKWLTWMIWRNVELKSFSSPLPTGGSFTHLSWESFTMSPVVMQNPEWYCNQRPELRSSLQKSPDTGCPDTPRLPEEVRVMFAMSCVKYEVCTLR